MAVRIYADWLHRLRIPERFPQTDWSIADKWIAKELLRQGLAAPRIAAILRAGSPFFSAPAFASRGYLGRTLARAARELETTPFPRRDARFLSL
jgi:hypothetical protein